jgi:hypothetical protein
MFPAVDDTSVPATSLVSSTIWSLQLLEWIQVTYNLIRETFSRNHNLFMMTKISLIPLYFLKPSLWLSTMSSDVLCYFVGNKPLTRGAEKNYQ